MQTYDTLEQRYKDVIDEVRLKIGDNDEDNPLLSNDLYAVLLTSDVVDDINGTQPITKLNLQTMYGSYRGLLTLGLRVWAYSCLIDKYVEVPNFEGLQVAQATIRDYSQRWTASLNLWAPKYEKKKAAMKSRLMPGPRLSIGEDYSGLAGLRYWQPSMRRRMY